MGALSAAIVVPWPPGSVMNATFLPAPNAVDYVLLYQGTIGTSNNVPLDPVDTNIALAVTTFTTPPFLGGGRSVIAERFVQGFLDIYHTPPTYSRGQIGFYTTSPMEWSQGRRFTQYTENDTSLLDRTMTTDENFFWYFLAQTGEIDSAVLYFNAVNGAFVIPVINIAQNNVYGSPQTTTGVAFPSPAPTSEAPPYTYANTTSYPCFSIDSYPLFGVSPSEVSDDDANLTVAFQTDTGLTATSIAVAPTAQPTSKESMQAQLSAPVDYGAFVTSMFYNIQWSPSSGHFSVADVDELFQSKGFSPVGQLTDNVYVPPGFFFNGGFEIEGDDRMILFNDPNYEQNYYFGGGGVLQPLPDMSSFDGSPMISSDVGYPGSGAEGSGSIPQLFTSPPSYVLAATGDNRVCVCISQVQVAGPYTITEYTVMLISGAYSLINPSVVRTGVATGLVMIPPPGVTVTGADTPSEAWTYPATFSWALSGPYSSLTSFPIGKVRLLTQP